MARKTTSKGFAPNAGEDMDSDEMMATNRPQMIKGNHPDVIAANVRTLKSKGMSHAQATHLSLKHARKHGTKSLVKKVIKFDTKKPVVR